MAIALAASASADESYSPYVDHIRPTQVFWGDTHVHTNLSADAVFTLGQDEAYRFARGEEVMSISGQPAKLARPLDFVVLAEHGKNMGAQWAREWSRADPAFRRTTVGMLWATVREELLSASGASPERITNGRLWPRSLQDVEVQNLDFRRTIWDLVTSNADRYNDPGKFTAFIGYEYTPFFPTVHRVVIFRDGGETVSQMLPFTAFDSDRPEDLWEFLESYEQKTGGRALAIPHNGNLTSGKMFAVVNSDGAPLDRKYAEARARWEPLVEATQIKGDSETHPVVSPEDEFADFETWNGWRGRGGNEATGKPIARASDLVQYEYVRPALKLGLAQQTATGVNPFKFGMIGSSDNHMALPGSSAESNFWGYSPSAARVIADYPTVNWEMNAAGYAAVWALENTREAIFDAMRRREVYTSTGPRMTVRFFGGWDFNPDDAVRPDPARTGYAKGVPMGADLVPVRGDSAPQFLIWAIKDPEGANLDRIQVIKGWQDNGGELHEKVFDVALSDGREVKPDGSVEPVGSTVDVANASYTNSIGDTELAVVWEDPDFDPADPAMYYVRVLEIPTPRWTAYDAKFYVAKTYSVESLDKEIPLVTQERVYASPIWYTP